MERVQNQLALELVGRARAGSRWAYSMVMRNGQASTEDSARMTAHPDAGYWRATAQWLKEEVRPVTTGHVRAVSRSGEVCRAAFAHRQG